MKYRYQTDFPVQVSTAFGRQSAHLANVTADGAQLTGLRDLRRGDKLQLDVLSHHVAAVVVWVDGDRTGVCFRPKLSSHLLSTRQFGIKPHTGDYSPSMGYQYANS